MARVTLWILFLELAAAPLSVIQTAQSAGHVTRNAGWDLGHGRQVLFDNYREAIVSNHSDENVVQGVQRKREVRLVTSAPEGSWSLLTCMSLSAQL